MNFTFTPLDWLENLHEFNTFASHKATNFLNLKKVWITGASDGIGAALAKYYNGKGYYTILSGRNIENLKVTREELHSSKNSDIISFDVNDFSKAEESVKHLLTIHRTPDIIILNAGISQRSLAIDTKMEVTEKLIRTNFLSNVNIMNSMIKEIIDNKSHIVVITSVTGKIGTPMRSSYAASKHALHGYFDSFRAENSKYGVKITLVCPGYIRTQISINALTGDGSAQKTMDKTTGSGMLPETLAAKIYSAVKKGKSEVYIGGKEILGIYLKRFFPKLLERIIRNITP